MASKLLSVSFSIWPEYLSDEQYALEIPYKTNKKRQVFFLVRSENKKGKSRLWGREKKEDNLK